MFAGLRIYSIASLLEYFLCPFIHRFLFMSSETQDGNCKGNECFSKSKRISQVTISGNYFHNIAKTD